MVSARFVHSTDSNETLEVINNKEGKNSPGIEIVIASKKNSPFLMKGKQYVHCTSSIIFD